MTKGEWNIGMMKKIVCLSLLLVFTISQAFTAFGTERIVQLTIPGCFS